MLSDMRRETLELCPTVTNNPNTSQMCWIAKQLSNITYAHKTAHSPQQPVGRFTRALLRSDPKPPSRQRKHPPFISCYSVLVLGNVTNALTFGSAPYFAFVLAYFWTLNKNICVCRRFRRKVLIRETLRMSLNAVLNYTFAHKAPSLIPDWVIVSDLSSLMTAGPPRALNIHERKCLTRWQWCTEWPC